jgi:hypothetical protein
MTTVLVHAASDHDHPVQQKIRGWLEPPEYIHYMTPDLAGFLAGIATSVTVSTGEAAVPAAG